MQQIPLKYVLKYIQNKQSQLIGIRIQFQNPFFAKTVKFVTLDKFPKSKISEYEYQCHPRFIEFRNHNEGANENQIKQFAKQINKILSQIRVHRIKKRKKMQNRNYSTMQQLLNFSCCIGYRIVKKQTEDYSVGEFVLFYYKQKQEQVKRLISCIKFYRNNIIDYALSQIISKYQIPEDLVRSVFTEMINCYGDEIKAVGTYYQFNIYNMGVCKRSEMGAQKQWFIAFYVQGVASNTHIFYLALEHTLNSIPLHLVHINTIKSVKMNKIVNQLPCNQNIRMVNANYLLIMNRNYNSNSIQDLTLGYFFLTADYIRQQTRNVLKIYKDSDRFKNWIKDKQLDIKQIEIYDQFVLLKCYNKNMCTIASQLNKLADKLILEKVKVTQFNENLVMNVFFKNYKQKVERKVYVVFSVINKQLWRQNFTVDTQKIILELKTLKQQILRDFVQIPSLKPVSIYQSNLLQFQNLYTVIKNPINCWQKNLRSIKYKLQTNQAYVNFILTEFDNLVSYKEQIIFILHNDLPMISKIYTISIENQININQFFAKTKGQNACRVKNFTCKNSMWYRNIMLLYFDVKNVNLRHIQQDITGCLKSTENDSQLNLFVGLQSKRLIQQIFPKLFQHINEMTNRNQIRIQNINIYYEEPNLLSILQRVIVNQKLQFSLVTRDMFDKWAILKMNNLRQYVLSYYWNRQTYELPGLDSYICHFKKTKSSRGRFLLTIPTPQYIQRKYKQYLIDFKQKKVYQILDFAVIQYNTNQTSKQMQRLIAFISKQFAQTQFFISYALDFEKQIGKTICMSIYYSNAQNEQLIPLQFDLSNRRTRVKTQSESLPFVITKKTYVDWFKIITHKKCLPTLIQCLQK